MRLVALLSAALLLGSVWAVPANAYPDRCPDPPAPCASPYEASDELEVVPTEVPISKPPARTERPMLSTSQPTPERKPVRVGLPKTGA